MKGRDALRELVTATPAQPQTAAAPPKRAAGAVRAMSLNLQQLSTEAAEAKSLREALAGSEAVVQLDPAGIDPSPVVDRIPIDDDPAFDELKAAIAEKGQQVPILVRPHPERAGRYQVAYGRRRLRVARELGVPVRAIVRQLSDRDLVIAQAQENGPRADLTFIERALYAANLETHGFDRDTITAALGVDKPELSRLLTVARVITPTVITAIGPAPKIGRPRWLALVEKCQHPNASALAADVLRRPKFGKLDTNARFNFVLAAFSGPTGDPSRKTAVTTAKGQRVAWLERVKKGIRISAEQPAFAAFLEERLPTLLKEFEAADQGAVPHTAEG